MIKVGVVGLGEVAQLMHLPILHDLSERYKITAVSDISPGLVRFIREKYSVAEGFDDFRKLIVESDTDAIWVLSPDQYHGEAISLALENGKHVFLEKPATLASSELIKLLELQKKYPSQVVMVGFMRRYAGAFLKAKEIMAQSPKPTSYLRFRDIICEGPFFIGQTRPVYYPKDLPDTELEEGRKLHSQHLDMAVGQGATPGKRKIYTMLTGLGSHSFSAVRELFGLPVRVVSAVSKGDHLVVILDYGDFLATYEMINDQNVVQFDAAIEIFQDSRKLHIKYETPYIRYQPTTLQLTESDPNQTKTIHYGPDYTDPFQSELLEFADLVADRRQPKTTLEDSLEDLLLFEEIIRKLEESRE